MIRQNLQTLVAALEKRYQLHPVMTAFLKSTLRRKVCNKGTLLVNKDEVPQRIYFHFSGITLGYYFDGDNNKIGSWFCDEHQLIGNLHDFISGERSKEQIKALKDTTVYYLEKEDAIKWIEYLFELRPVLLRVMNERSSQLEIRSKVRDIIDNKKKIKTIKKRYEGLIYNLPHEFLASFLGMTRQWVGTHLKEID